MITPPPLFLILMLIPFSCYFSWGNRALHSGAHTPADFADSPHSEIITEAALWSRRERARAKQEMPGHSDLRGFRPQDTSPSAVRHGQRLGTRASARTETHPSILTITSEEKNIKREPEAWHLRVAADLGGSPLPSGLSFPTCRPRLPESIPAAFQARAFPGAGRGAFLGSPSREDAPHRGRAEGPLLPGSH